LAEKKSAAEGLKIFAPLDGFIFQRDLERRLGSFAHRGDEILTIAPLNSKEVVVSIDQRNLDLIRNSLGEPIRIVLPGLPAFQSLLSRINPQASTHSTPSSLCAHAARFLCAQSQETTTRLMTLNLNCLGPDSTLLLNCHQFKVASCTPVKEVGQYFQRANNH
jgi:hypothetical protein